MSRSLYDKISDNAKLFHSKRSPKNKKKLRKYVLEETVKLLRAGKKIPPEVASFLDKGTPLPEAAPVAKSSRNPPKKRQAKPSPAKKRFKSKFNDFYRSAEWKQARYSALAASDGKCQLCGASKHDGVKLQVDHKTPLSMDYSRRLDPTNLQVLCASCNWGKGGQYGDFEEAPPARIIWCDDPEE